MNENSVSEPANTGTQPYVPFAKINPNKRNAFIDDLKKQKNGSEMLAHDIVVETIKKHFDPTDEVTVEDPRGVGVIFSVPMIEGRLILSANQLHNFI